MTQPVKEIARGTPDVGALLPGAWKLLNKLFADYLHDPKVKEILINRPNELWVLGREPLPEKITTTIAPRLLRDVFQLISNENNVPLNADNPILSGDLTDGSRIELIIPPAAEHYTLSIRRHRPTTKRLSEYQKDGYFMSVKGASERHVDDGEETLKQLYRDGRWCEFLVAAVQAKKNIVVSGGTDTGKTTLLNALLAEIPLDERIITLENARELKLSHENVVRLSTRSGGKVKVSMEDLIKSCLRLNPDRIMLGEIRGKEVLQFIAAASTGHEGSMTSIHANNPHLAMMRLKQFYQQNPEAASMRDEQIMAEINNVVDVIVQAGFDKYNRRWFATDIYYKAIGWGEAYVN